MYSALKQMSEERYQIQEELTTGWSLPGPEYENLTKERAKELLEYLYSRGASPEHIRVVREKWTMKSPLTSLTNHLMDTDTKQFVRTLLLLQFGLYVILGLFTMVVMTSVVSGDSTTQKRDATMRLLTPPSKEIR